MRANNFGDLWFMDHVTITLADVKFLVIIVVDASSNLLWAGPQVSGTIAATVEQFERCQSELNERPTCIVADSFFMTRKWKTYWRAQGIKWIDLGDHTPWPNRAEAAVKVLDIMQKFLSNLQLHSRLNLRFWPRSQMELCSRTQPGCAILQSPMVLKHNLKLPLVDDHQMSFN